MTKETKKIYIDQLGHDPHVRRLVAEVPVTWTDEEVERLSGIELEDRFYLDADWENTGDPVVAQEEIKVIGDAPDESVPDVFLVGDPPSPKLNGERDRAVHCDAAAIEVLLSAEQRHTVNEQAFPHDNEEIVPKKSNHESDTGDDCDAAGLSGEDLGLHDDELEKFRIACLAIWGLFTAEERRTINEQKFHQRCESWVLHAIGRLATEMDGSKDDPVVDQDDLKVVGDALDNSSSPSAQFRMDGDGDPENSVAG